MSLIKWNNPVDVMPGFSSLIDNFFGRDISDYLGDASGSVPAVNVKETKDNFTLEVAAPGMEKEDFEVKFDHNVLTVSGKKEMKKEEKEEKYSRREFRYTSFQRSFHMPEAVNTENIEAHYKDGILMITVPKKEEAKEKAPKKISIS
jgi:HSP20 family protein